MKEITKEAVFAAHKQKPKRRCFATHSGIITSFSVNFAETIKPIFEHDTGLELYCGKQRDNYFRYIKNDDELEEIQQWVERQGSRIYLRDCLSLSIAMDHNLKDNTSAEYTEIGYLEYRGKEHGDSDAIDQLADKVSEVIQDLPYYRDADLMCSVPPMPDKDFDLPREVTRLASEKLRKRDVTCGFVFGERKSSAKASALDGKWNVWENAKVSFQKFNVTGKKIILIDDKYQSGRTIQHIAMKLQQAGAYAVYGLCFVKTLGDEDNVSSISF